MKDDDIFGLFRKTPDEKRRDEAILSTLLPSDYIPNPGEHFRMRFATYADRSWMDVIWKCTAFQDGAVAAYAVHGMNYGDKKRVFIVGDVLFYPAEELAKALRDPQPPMLKIVT